MAHDTAVIDAFFPNPVFFGDVYQRFLPAAEGCDPLRARMHTLINNERAALEMPPL